MGKIGWKCVISQCTSNTKIPGHFFPKNQKITKKWLDIISVPELNSLSEEAIRKCKVCHLHFSPDSYIFSLNRRRLKHDALPTLNLYHQTEDIPQPSTNAQDNITLNNGIQLNEENVNNIIVEEQHVDTQVENLNSPSLPTHTLIVEEEQHVETQIENTPKSSRLSTYTRIVKEKQDIETQIENTPNSSHLSIHAKRSILGSVTRKNLLTPKARQLYNKTLTLRKRNVALQSNLLSYKQRLKYATKFSDHIFFKKYQTLTNSQKLFINMQLKNVKKSPKVHFPTFCKNMTSALKSVCGKHASVFLNNIGLSNSQENM